MLVPADHLDAGVDAAKATIKPLDLAAEIERYGASTRGGVGVSSPAPAQALIVGMSAPVRARRKLSGFSPS